MKFITQNIDKILLTIFLLFWLALIFYFSAQPGEISAQTSAEVVENIQKISSHKISQKTIRKTAHFVIYMGLGAITIFTTRAYFGKIKPFLTVLFCGLYAATDEFHQSFVPARGPMVTDVLLDTLGATISVLIITAIFYFYNKKRNPVNSSEEKINES